MSPENARTPPPHLAFLAPPKREGELGRLGDYRVYKQLGEGSMGIVLKADNRTTGELVAVKVLRPELVGVGSRSYDRFMREARITAQLRHPNIVPTVDTGTVPMENVGDVPYMVMPYLQGEPLEAYLARLRQMPVADVLRVGAGVADGLTVAHEQAEPLIHRDIKPANIWLDSGGGPPDPAGKFRGVKILDFGLARAIEDKENLSVSGMLIGTVNYMAPEQSKGQPLGVQTDLYALGATLYECLTGKKAVPGDNMMQVLHNLSFHDPVPPHEVNSDVPPELSKLVLKLLEKDPKDRPATARWVADAFRALAAGKALPPEGPTKPPGGGNQDVHKRPEKDNPRPEPVARRGGRYDAALYALGLLLLAGGGVFAYLAWQDMQKAPPGDNKTPGKPVVVAPKPPAVVPPKQDAPPPDLEKKPAAASDRKPAWRWGAGGAVLALAAAPGRLAAAADDGRVVLLDPATGRPATAAPLAHDKPVRAVALSPDAAAVATASDAYLRFWDAATGKPRSQPKKLHTKPITALAYAPDGAHVVTASEDTVVRLVDVALMRPVRSFRGHDGAVRSAAVAPDGTRIASAAADRTVRVWSAADADRMPLVVETHADGGAVALSASALAAASGEADAVVADPATGGVRHTLAGHSLPVVAVAFSADGALLATAGEDDLVKVWDAATGRLTLTLTGHNGPVRAVAFLNGRLFTGGDDKTVLAWDVR